MPKKRTKSESDKATTTVPCLEIGGRPVAPFNLASYTFLQRLGNPITEPSDKPVSERLSNFQFMELCFVITHPLAESRKLHRQGANAWEAAVYDFCEVIPLETLADVGYKVGLLIAQAAAVITKTESENKAQS